METEESAGRKRRLDSSCERTTDKRPRAQFDIDCLTANDLGDVSPLRSSPDMTHFQRSVSSNWFPVAYGLAMSFLNVMFPGMM